MPINNKRIVILYGRSRKCFKTVGVLSAVTLAI